MQTLEKLQYSLNAEKIRRALRPPSATVEEELDMAHRYAQAYFDALHLGMQFW